MTRIKTWQIVVVAAVSLTVLAIFAPLQVAWAQQKFSQSQTLFDWNQLSYDDHNTGRTPETILNASNVNSLTGGLVQTDGVISTAPTVVNHVISVGTWAGNQHWYDWKGEEKVGPPAFLGTNNQPQCNPPNVGIGSTATRKNGLMYVGGNNGNDGSSNAYFFVINDHTHQILGAMSLGDLNKGVFNWSSPLIVGNVAYTGLASLGDCPLVRGGLAMINISKPAQPVIEKITYFVDPNETGGSVWTKPALSQNGQTIFVTTGTATIKNNAQPLAEAMIALDANTLKVKWHWRINDPTLLDYDWSISPMDYIYHNRELVSSVNKNGWLYTLDANRGAILWQKRIGVGGNSPINGTAPASSGVFVPDNGGEIIYGAGIAPKDDPQCPNARGTVRALNPLTGQILWEHCSPGIVLASLAAGDGFVVTGADNTIEILSNQNGARLYGSALAAPIYAEPTISGGYILVGSSNGQLVALALQLAN